MFGSKDRSSLRSRTRSHSAHSRHRRLALSCALAAGALATAPTAAHAQAQLDPIVEENLGSVSQFYASESGAADMPCDVGCTALVNDLRRAPTAPKDPVVPRVLKSLVDKGASTVRSPWKMPAATLTAAGALLAGNVYVWKVHVFGAKPKDYFIKVPVEAFHASDVDMWSAVDGTDPLYYPTFYDKPSPLPVGVIARTNGRGSVLWQTGGTRCAEPGPTSTPVGVEEYVWHWNRCFEGYVDGVETYSDLYAHGWKISIDTLFDRWYDAQNSPDTPTTYPIDGVALTPAEIEQRLRELLASGELDYKTLEDWIKAVFGDGVTKNPKDDYFTMPSCRGVAIDMCTTQLRNAGLLGTITTTTLSSDDAVLEQAARRVTDTQPTPGTEVAEDAKLEIYVNPSKLPNMTTAETSVANSLATKNPEVVNDTNKKTLARRCVRYTKAAGRSTNDCTALPIIVQGNDVPGPATNELAALVRNPSWVALNRRVSPPRTAWYADRADPAPGCVKSQRARQLDQCDEFPFWSTLQAFGGTLNTAIPSIRWVRQKENQRQGTVLNQFYSANAPGTNLPFKGCNITAQNATDVAPVAASTFLNVPVAAGVPIASVGICNKP